MTMSGNSWDSRDNNGRINILTEENKTMLIGTSGIALVILGLLSALMVDSYFEKNFELKMYENGYRKVAICNNNFKVLTTVWSNNSEDVVYLEGDKK